MEIIHSFLRLKSRKLVTDTKRCCVRLFLFISDVKLGILTKSNGTNLNTLSH